MSFNMKGSDRGICSIAQETTYIKRGPKCILASIEWKEFLKLLQVRHLSQLCNDETTNLEKGQATQQRPLL